MVSRRLAAQHPDVDQAMRERDARLVTYVALAATRHAWMTSAATDDQLIMPNRRDSPGVRRSRARAPLFGCELIDYAH